MSSTAITRSNPGREASRLDREDSLSTKSRRPTADHLIGSVPEMRRFGTEQGFCVVNARAGDHHDIHALLVSVLHQPSSAEFQAQLDDPFYEPNDRLLVKRGNQIVAHARISNREMHLSGRLLPISSLSDLVVLPEYRGEDCALELVHAAECAMIESGSQMAFLHSSTWILRSIRLDGRCAPQLLNRWCSRHFVETSATGNTCSQPARAGRTADEYSHVAPRRTSGPNTPVQAKIRTRVRSFNTH